MKYLPSKINTLRDYQSQSKSFTVNNATWTQQLFLSSRHNETIAMEHQTHPTARCKRKHVSVELSDYDKLLNGKNR